MAQTRNGIPLFLINIALILVLAVVLVSAVFAYKRKIDDITIGDNRYLTTEWHLLQELKAKTDEELRDKDREISLLRDKYDELVRNGVSEEMKRELEAELATAERERERILSRRLLATETDIPDSAPAGTRPADGSASVGSASDSTAPGDDSTALTILLGKRISSLEAQSAAYRLRAEAAEKKLADAEAALIAKSKSLFERTVDGQSDAGNLEILRTLMTEKRDELGAMPSPSIDDLKTRSLLRAILTTPAIKSEYPDLLKSMDRYFESYGKQEWQTGQRDAYAFMLESLNALRAK